MKILKVILKIILSFLILMLLFHTMCAVAVLEQNGWSLKATKKTIEYIYNGTYMKYQEKREDRLEKEDFFEK